MLKVAVMGVNYAHSLQTLNDIVKNDREEEDIWEDFIFSDEREE